MTDRARASPVPRAEKKRRGKAGITAAVLRQGKDEMKNPTTAVKMPSAKTSGIHTGIHSCSPKMI